MYTHERNRRESACKFLCLGIHAYNICNDVVIVKIFGDKFSIICVYESYACSVFICVYMRVVLFVICTIWIDGDQTARRQSRIPFLFMYFFIECEICCERKNKATEDEEEKNAWKWTIKVCLTLLCVWIPIFDFYKIIKWKKGK